MKGLLVVISGPSGAGKGTIVKELLKDDKYVFSISATTRKPRAGEEDGREYFFTTKDEFQTLITEDNLLEYAEYVGNFYGTPRKYIEHQISQGKIILLDIEVVGALQVKEKLPDAVLIFLAPPSMEELRRRLEGRNTEATDVIESRIKRAQEEMDLVHKYDYIVTNDTVLLTVQQINEIVRRKQSC